MFFIIIIFFFFLLIFLKKFLVQSPLPQGSEYVATLGFYLCHHLAKLPRYQGSESLYRPDLLGNAFVHRAQF